MKKFIRLPLVVLGLLSGALLHGQYTGSNENVAAKKYVEASDSTAGFEPRYAVDTTLSTYAAIPGAAPAWIQIDLGNYHLIDGFGLVMLRAGELSSDFSVQVSEDGGTWTDLGNFGVSATGSYSYDLVHADPIQFFRIAMSQTDNPASFTEIMVYGEELLVPPTPLCKEATNVTASGFRANWFERPTATGYRLDVSTEFNFTSFVPGYNNKFTGNELFHDVVGLEPGVTYYYRIRAYNLAGTSDQSNRITVGTLKADQSISFDPLPDQVYGDPDLILAASSTSGLACSYASSDPGVAVVTGNQLTIVGSGSVSITASQEGNDQYNPATPVIQNLTIAQKLLTVVGALAENKVYDGNADASISGAALAGMIGPDVVELVNAEAGTFAQAQVGSGIAVSTSMSIQGTDSQHYTLEQPSGLTADITALTLTVDGVVAENKVYDGNTTAQLSGGSLQGIIDGDQVNLASIGSGMFTQAEVGTGIAVTTDLSLSGPDAGNYLLEQPGGIVADILVKELSVDATAEDKVYDGGDAATVSGATLQGVIAGDQVLLQDASSGTFAQSDAGNDLEVTTQMSLSGADEANYTLLAPALTASITKKSLTASPEDSQREACAEDPEFSISYDGFVDGEDASVLDMEPGGQSNADPSSDPGVYEISLSGGMDNNYAFVYNTGKLTVYPDQTAPVLEVKDITVYVSEGATTTISPADVVSSADDNCALADTSLNRDSFTTNDIGVVNIEVTLTDESGNSSTAPAQVTVELSNGIDDASHSMVSFFPNPVKDVLRVESPREQAQLITLTSLNGKVVLQQELQGSHNEIDLSSLKAGVYFIRWSSNELQEVQKIVKY